MSKQALSLIAASVIVIVIVVGFWIWTEMRTSDLETRITAAEAQLVVTEEQAIECQERVGELLDLLEDCGIDPDSKPAVSGLQEEPCVTKTDIAGG